MTRIWSSMSDIYIDADGCPVIEETLQAGEDFGFPVTLVCDTSHVFPYEHVVILMADKGRDSTDFLLLSHVKKGDIVVTQDYGLAALVLSKEGYPISAMESPIQRKTSIAFSQCVMSAVWSVSMAITEIMRKSGHSRTMNGFWMVCMHCVKVCRINKNGYTGCFPHLFEWGIP